MSHRSDGRQFLRKLRQLIVPTAVGMILHPSRLLSFCTTAEAVEVSVVSKISARNGMLVTSLEDSRGD